MSRIAVIDMGTNTFNLLVGEKVGEEVRRIYTCREVVKLGEGGLADGIIRPVPFGRGLTAIQKLVQQANTLGASAIYGLATSGIRSTANGADFVAQAADLTGIKIDIIEGLEEARLIYHGAIVAVEEPQFPLLIMDIGGGSTEFIIADHEGILWSESFKIGVSRMKETFQPSDPITEKELRDIEMHLDTELASLLNAMNQYQPTMLIGSAGSFDSFAQMLQPDREDELAMDGSVTYDFEVTALNKLIAKILSSTYVERLDMPGLVKMRADMIVLAAVQLQFILFHLTPTQVRLSNFSMKEGYLFEKLKNA